ncbi:MAG: multidrug effflux MFS transporter [Pseudomonadota bacterium]
MAPLAPPFWLLVLAVALMPFSFNAIIAGLPDIAAALSVSYAQTSVLLSGFMVVNGLSPLVYGPLSDTFGRQRVLLFGLGLAVIASGLASVATSYEMVLLARIGQGAGMGAGMVLVRAIVRDCYGPEKTGSMIAIITMTMVIIPIITPLMSGFIVGFFDWRMTFHLITLAAVGVFLCVWRWGRETHTGHRFSFSALARDYTHVLGQASFWRYALLLTLTSGIFFSFIAAAPHAVITLLGYSEQAFGTYFIASGTGYIFGNFIASRRIPHWGLERTITTGLLISMIGVAGGSILAPSGLTIEIIFGAMVFVGVGNGIALPALMGSVVSGAPEHAGTASGLSGFLQFTGGGLLMTLASRLVMDHAPPLLYLMVVLNLSALAVLIFWRRPKALA